MLFVRIFVRNVPSRLKLTFFTEFQRLFNAPRTTIQLLRYITVYVISLYTIFVNRSFQSADSNQSLAYSGDMHGFKTSFVCRGPKFPRHIDIDIHY